MQQPQQRRVQRRIQLAERLVVAVGGEQVLHEVVGADGNEIDRGDEAGQRDRGGGHFDHRTERDRVGGPWPWPRTSRTARCSSLRTASTSSRLLIIGSSTRTGP